MKSGYALITLLVFMTTAMIITSAAVVVIATNSKAATTLSVAEEALAIAESGADSAVLRLLRNSSYTGETISMGNGQAVISVTGASTKTIIVEATVATIRRKIQVTGSFNNTIFTVQTWQEVE